MTTNLFERILTQLSESLERRRNEDLRRNLKMLITLWNLSSLKKMMMTLLTSSSLQLLRKTDIQESKWALLKISWKELNRSLEMMMRMMINRFDLRKRKISEVELKLNLIELLYQNLRLTMKSKFLRKTFLKGYKLDSLID